MDDALRVWLLEQVTADETDERADVAVKRDLIEWAYGIETLRTLGDPAAPERAVGDEVLRILASGYTGRPGYRDEWRD